MRRYQLFLSSFLLSLVCLTTAMPSRAWADAGVDFSGEIREVLSRAVPADGPGAVVVVVKDGKVVSGRARTSRAGD